METTYFENWHKREANFNSICFLCGTELLKENSSKEHIFPKWLLKEFDIFNSRIGLQNKTSFPYRKAVVPSCKKCNNNDLGNLEKHIRSNIHKNRKEFLKEVSLLQVYQWTLSIFYKVLLKESFLNVDQSINDSPKIISPHQFELLALNHLMLRSIDKEVSFSNFFPGSVFVFDTETSDKIGRNFDYLDSAPFQASCIRINQLGFITVFNDAEVLKKMLTSEYNKFVQRILNPTDFRFFYAKCLYEKTRFRDPYYYELSEKSSNSVKLHLQLKPGIKPETVFEPYSEIKKKMVYEQVFNLKL